MIPTRISHCRFRLIHRSRLGLIGNGEANHRRAATKATGTTQRRVSRFIRTFRIRSIFRTMTTIDLGRKSGESTRGGKRLTNARYGLIRCNPK